MQNEKVNNLLLYLFICSTGFYGFLWLHPFFTWNNNSIFIYGVINFTIFIVWAIGSNLKINRTNIISSLFAFILILLFSLKNEFFIRNVLIYSVSLLPIVLVGNEYRLKIYNFFVKVVSFSLLPSVIIAILLFIGIDLVWTELPSSSWTKPYYRNYFNLSIYHFYNGADQRYYLPWGGSIDRIAGLFDEPGVVGTVTALILVSKGLSLKYLHEKILFLAGILSFSFAFYLILFIYISIRKTKYIIWVLITLSILMYNVAEDSFINEKIFSRFKISNEGIAGDNRTNKGFDQLYNDFLINDNILTGIKEKEFLFRAKQYGSEALSWKTFFVIHGLILLLLHTIYFFVHVLSQKDKRIWFFAFIYFLSIYQRPYDFSLAYWLIFLGGLISYKCVIEEKSVLKGFKE